MPDKNVEKISYYRTWENRFNTFDGNIPGNDYQFPVDLEGALGYNNQISLTVPMRLQDLKFWRDPLYSYGPWLSQGEESGCQAFHDNPGNTGNWNNTYEQWTALARRGRATRSTAAPSRSSQQPRPATPSATSRARSRSSTPTATT